MNKALQDKIESYKKKAKTQGKTVSAKNDRTSRTDGLAKVIRSKEEAATFMAELESAIKRAK